MHSFESPCMKKLLWTWMWCSDMVWQITRTWANAPKNRFQVRPQPVRQPLAQWLWRAVGVDGQHRRGHHGSTCTRGFGQGKAGNECPLPLRVPRLRCPVSYACLFILGGDALWACLDAVMTASAHCMQVFDLLPSACCRMLLFCVHRSTMPAPVTVDTLKRLHGRQAADNSAA